MDITFLIVSFLLGAVLAWLMARLQSANDPTRLAREVVEKNYILRELANDWQRQINELKQQDVQKSGKIIELNKDIASVETQNLNLEERLAEQRTEVEKLQTRFQTEFENIANRLLQEKAQHFGAENRQQMDLLLNPLRQTIDGLKQNIQQQLTEETKQRSELRTQIDQLQQLNQQLSADAQNLVSAMRGDSKKQGDWGEWQLEMLLERAGLTRDVHFSAQLSLFDDEQRQKRPDFVIHLPDLKHLIIDSKVSLTAYERFFNEKDVDLQQKQLAQHVLSLREHIKNLGGKKYAALSNVNSPEYVLLFVPIEPALTTALQADPQLFNDALDRNIILVSVTTLLATMRTVAFTWKQENQKKNVLEIAWQSGLLYDKFVLFIEDLKRIGTQLDGAQSAYHDAFNKLQNSPKYGDTLIGRAEKIRQLGAKNQKNLPPDLLDS